METFIGTLYPTPPYNFERIIQLARFYTVIGQVDQGTYVRPLRLRTGTALVRVVNQGMVDSPALGVYLLAASGPLDVDELLRQVAHVFNIGADLRGFYAVARPDMVLWELVKPLYGLHMLQTESIYEALSVTIIEQQIALSAAQKGERWLVEWGGDLIEHDGQQHYLFPRAEQIATATTEALTPLKITFRRMSVLIEIARLEADQSLERLRRLTTPEVHAALLAIKGVGHWTAAWTLTRSMGRYTYVGSADVALRAAVNHYFFGQTGRSSPVETDMIFNRYGAYAGLACFYTLMHWALKKY